MNLFTNDDWILRPEKVAQEINGENIKVGSDLYFYFKMVIYEQGVFDRIAKTPDYTLADEIPKDTGYLMVGDPEKIRAKLHEWVDGAINSALQNRKNNETNKKD